MGLLDFLMPWRRQRHEAEKKTEEEFRNQLREALLNQQSLLDAVAHMRKAREDQEAESVSFRREMHRSRPSIT
jgi:hypothetical protein